MNFRKTVIALVFSNGFYALGNLAIIIIASRYFSSSEYGTYRQFFLISDFFVPILSVGLFQGIYYLLPKSTWPHQTFKRSVFILIATTTIFAVGTLGFGSKLSILIFNSDKFIFLIPLAIPIILGALLQSITTSAFVYAGQAKRIAKFNFIYITLYAIGSVILILAGKDFEHLLIYRAIISPLSYIMIAITGYMGLKSRLHDSEITPNATPIGPSYSEIIKYSFPIGLAGMIGIASQLTDKLIISSHSNAATYATYINGSVEIPLISIITGALATGAIAEMSKLCAESKTNEAHTLFKGISIVSGNFLLPAFVLLWITSDSLMITLFGSEYLSSSAIFRIYLLLLPIRLVFYGPALIALGKSKTILYRGLIELVLNLALSLFLMRHFGPHGVAIATVIVVYFWTVPFNLTQIAKGFSTSFFSVLPIFAIGKKLLICLIAAFAPLCLNLLYIDDGPIKLALSSAVYLPVVILLFHATGEIDIRRLFHRAATQ